VRGKILGETLLRSILTAWNLVLSGLIAHVVAGGSVINSRELFIYTFLVLIIALIPHLGSLDGPRLATYVSSVQALTHILPGGSSTSDLSMFLSHTGFGLVGFIVIRHCDAFLVSGSGIIQQLLPAFSRFNFKILESYQLTLQEIVSFRGFLFFNSFGSRSPPSLIIERCS
jgi:hypothetical protein